MPETLSGFCPGKFAWFACDVLLLSKIFKYLLPTLQVGFCTLLRVAVPLLSRYERVHDNVWSIHVYPVLDNICWHTNSDSFTIHPFQLFNHLIFISILLPRLLLHCYSCYIQQTFRRHKALPSLKLTVSHLKMDGWKTSFPFGMAYFQVRNVSFREGMRSSLEVAPPVSSCSGTLRPLQFVE